jgi:hypothetical protein
MARQPGGQFHLFQETFEQVDDGLCHGIVGHPQDNDALIVRWRVIGGCRQNPRRE